MSGESGIGVVNWGANSNLTLVNASLVQNLTGGYGINNNGVGSHLILDNSTYAATVGNATLEAVGIRSLGADSYIWLKGNTTFQQDINAKDTYDRGYGFYMTGRNAHLIIEDDVRFTQNTLAAHATGIYNAGEESYTVLRGNAVFSGSLSAGNSIRNQGKNSYFLIDENATYHVDVTGAGALGIFNSGENSSLVVHGGNFIQNVTGGVAVYNNATQSHVLIDGGNFTQNLTGTTGIRNNATDTYVQIVSGNYSVQVDGGYGIHNNAGNASLLMDGGNFTQNITSGNGIYNVGLNSTAKIRGGNFDQEISSGYGIFNYGEGASVEVSDGNFTQNITGGSGIRNEGEGSYAQISDGNYNVDVDGGGKGIYNTGANSSLVVDGGTFSQNVISGNGIHNTGEGSSVQLSNGSLTLNVSAGNGIYNEKDSASLKISGGNFVLDITAGSGIRNQAEARIEMSGGNYTANVDGGFGIHNAGANSSLTITGGTFNQTVTNGTGIYNNGANSLTSIGGTASFEQTIIGSSRVGIRNQGGEGASVLISGIDFSQDVRESGYGIYNNSTNGTVSIVGANFINTVAQGSGIANTGSATGAKIEIREGSFSQNVNGLTNSYGIYNNGTLNEVLITDGALFTTNSSTLYGGGIRNKGIVNIDNATAVFNLSSGGNGIWNSEADSSVTIKDAAFTINNTGFGAGIYNVGSISIDGDVEIDNIGTGNGIRNNGGTLHVKAGGNVTLSGGNAIVSAGNNAVLVIDGYVGGNGALDMQSGILAGSGYINNTFSMTGTDAKRLSPGAYVQGESVAVGTLTFGRSQSWLESLTYAWKLGNASASGLAGGNGNDWINIEGSLALGSGSYTLEASTTLLSPISDPSIYYEWVLLSTRDGISGFDASKWLLDFTDDWVALGIPNPSTSKYWLEQVDNDLVLKYLLSENFHWGLNAGNGTWGTRTKWEENGVPSLAGLNVYFTRDQQGSTEIDLEGGTNTLGNLTLGSENASATDTHYALINGTLTLDNNGNLSVIHHHLNAQGDEIAVTLNASNAVEIDIASKGNSSLENQSIGFTPSGETEWGRWNGKITNATLSGSGSNPMLTISGDLQMNGHDLSKTGNGTLVVSGDILGAHQIVHEAGSLYLDGTVRTNSDLTVAGQAILGGSGTIVGALIFEHQAIFRQGREGASYNDRLRVSGTAQAQGSMTFDLTAALGRAFSDNDGDSRKTATQSSGMDLTGLFSFNAASSYTVNIYNLTDFRIVDWTREKNANEGAYYQLLSWEGGDGDIDLDKWSLNFLGSVRPDDPGAWSLKLGKEGDKHILWLYYANPVRIPEPGTYAAIAGALALVLALIRRRRK